MVQIVAVKACEFDQPVVIVERDAALLERAQPVFAQLPPMSAPTRFTVRVLVGSGVITRSFEATPSKTRVGVGMLSVTGSLGSGGRGLAYEGRGQGYFETPLGAGKLYVPVRRRCAAGLDRSARLRRPTAQC